MPETDVGATVWLVAPGSEVVTMPTTPRYAAWKIAADLPDPEVPVVTIGDLGILRDVTEDDQGRVHVQLTPKYPGCPAMETISARLVEALTCAGYQHVDVEYVLSPPWTTDWMTEEARAKLEAHGIATPHAAGERLSIRGGEVRRFPVA